MQPLLAICSQYRVGSSVREQSKRLRVCVSVFNCHCLLPTKMFPLARDNGNHSSYYRVVVRGKKREQALGSPGCFCPEENILESKPASHKILETAFLFEKETEGGDIKGERDKRRAKKEGKLVFTP